MKKIIISLFILLYIISCKKHKVYPNYGEFNIVINGENWRFPVGKPNGVEISSNGFYRFAVEFAHFDSNKQLDRLWGIVNVEERLGRQAISHITMAQEDSTTYVIYYHTIADWFIAEYEVDTSAVNFIEFTQLEPTRLIGNMQMTLLLDTTSTIFSDLPKKLILENGQIELKKTW